MVSVRAVGVAVVIVLFAAVAVGGALASPGHGNGAAVGVDTSDSLSPAETHAAQHPATENATVEIVFFHLPTCPHCANVEAYLDEQRSEYDFRVEKYNARDNSERFTEYLQEYDVPRDDWGAVPAVFVDDEYAIGDRPSIDLIESRLEAATEAPTETTDGVAGDASNAESDGDLEAVTLVGLAGMAATDAVNPCALAVLLVLLTTILTRNPEDHGRVLRAGLAFSIAVALTYAAMGALLVFGLKSVASVGSIDLPIVRRLFGVLAIGLGLLNLKDAISHGAGGFAMEVPERWRPAMQRRLTDPLWTRESAVVGSALAGVGVSLFLLPCTAGPYLVAGGLLANQAWPTAIALLVVYNLIFVAPMLAITVAVSGGFATADAVGTWRERHVEGLHLVAGLLLVAIGVALAVGLL
ncbi:GAP family protein [Halococcoides cellulosivorans]|uniref:Glutaredoxin domain-containing protein n=1 Tax=Halococcoides cellulosivorans TaxID=1679096 RepID=A0A2R4WXM9_9EURY|nr:GAP family protein [Halococcoides cellulosivorans]AWB26297.1 hypothetical protein HARCEL1_00465 [Halococcoides cellulosivorans]